VIGFRAGLIATILCDEKETDEVVNFATWVADYVLSQQLDLFGEEMNRLMLASEDITQRQQVSLNYQSLLSSLPEEFTLEQLVELRMQAGYRSPVRQVIWRWTRNRIVEKVDAHSYRKIG
jgi:hypothetical protein